MFPLLNSFHIPTIFWNQFRMYRFHCRRFVRYRHLIVLGLVSFLFILDYLAHNGISTSSRKYFFIENGMDKREYNLELDNLSSRFQAHLGILQNPRLCSQTAMIKCGSSSPCGFGCQFQHRIGCLALSYTLDLPLVHDKNTNWYFSEPWGKYLKPLGTRCAMDLKTIIWDWDSLKEWQRLLRFPLRQGIPVSTQFGNQIERNHKNPYLWFVGQFAKAIFKLNDETLGRIQGFKEMLGITRKQLKGLPLLGIHVRRTDKFLETQARLTVQDYMNTATEYKKSLRKYQGIPVTVFLATDDCEVLPEFRRKYQGSEWNIVGFCNETLGSQQERQGHLFDILRDVSILVDSDYVICTYSSNICRTILELRAAKYNDPDPERSIKSLDGEFSLILWRVFEFLPSTLVHVDLPQYLF